MYSHYYVCTTKLQFNVESRNVSFMWFLFASGILAMMSDLQAQLP